MAKITNLGRVAGSRWFTGTSFSVAINPLDGDLFFNSETLEFFKYIEKTNQWIAIGKITVENYVVAENVKTSEDVTKSIAGIPVQEIFSYENGKLVSKVIESERSRNAQYADRAICDEHGNNISLTYATFDDIDDLIDIDHSAFAKKDDIKNGIIVPGSINLDTRIENTDNETGNILSIAVLGEYFEVENDIFTGKVLKSVEADSAVNADNSINAVNADNATNAQKAEVAILATNAIQLGEIAAYSILDQDVSGKNISTVKTATKSKYVSGSSYEIISDGTEVEVDKRGLYVLTIQELSEDLSTVNGYTTSFLSIWDKNKISTTRIDGAFQLFYNFIGHENKIFISDDPSTNATYKIVDCKIIMEYEY